MSAATMAGKPPIQGKAVVDKKRPTIKPDQRLVFDACKDQRRPQSSLLYPT